jgi:hypothetical protein
MKLQAVTFALLLTLGSSLACAQSSGGGGGAGGASGAAGATGSPSAGSAGAGSLGTNGVPLGPANPAGLNNAGNAPSGNAPKFNLGTTTGLANPSPTPSPSTPASGGVRMLSNPPPDTNSLGTASSDRGVRRANGRRVPGPKARTTSTRNGDAAIDAENRKLDKMVKSICKGC